MTAMDLGQWIIIGCLFVTVILLAVKVGNDR